MKFVNCARNTEEQNLVLLQDGDQLYYESCREIIHGEELLVWYGNRYHMFMGIPTGIKTAERTNQWKEQINETGQGESGFNTTFHIGLLGNKATSSFTRNDPETNKEFAILESTMKKIIMSRFFFNFLKS